METRRFCYALFSLLAFAVTVSGCIQTPSGASQQSTASVRLSGATRQPNQVIDFYVRDRRGAEVGVAPAETLLAAVSATTSSTEIVAGDGLYALSVTIPASALPASSWIPQVSDGRMQGGLPRSVGRVEIVGRPHGAGQPNLKTFTPAALTCAQAAANPTAALACADGDSFLVYDNDGVGIDGAAPTAVDFVQIAGSPFALSGAASGIDLEIGTYSVPGLSSPVNAVVCHPHAPVPAPGRRTVVLHHGGYQLDAGALDACVNWARAGWLAALSAYRFEPVTAIVPPPFPPAAYTYPSAIERPGTTDLPELCLGEVTDALRWLDIVRARTDTDDARMLMWGYSHGACVTLRSLEQGAKVKAAVAVSAPTEFFMWETFSTNTNPPGAAGIHALLGGTPAALPDAYRARSAARMAVDLQRRSDLRLLQIAVQKDTLVHPSQGCRMANAIGAENHQMLAGGEYSPSAASPVGVDFAGCITGYLTWTGGAPVSWNQRAMFLLYANITPIDGHAFFGYTTPPPAGGSWAIPLNRGIRDFLQASFP
jgi:dienelactone hydrolase